MMMQTAKASGQADFRDGAKSPGEQGRDLDHTGRNGPLPQKGPFSHPTGPAPRPVQVCPKTRAPKSTQLPIFVNKVLSEHSPAVICGLSVNTFILQGQS